MNSHLADLNLNLPISACYAAQPGTLASRFPWQQALCSEEVAP